MLSYVQLFATLWTIARQAPLFKEFSGKNTGVGIFLIRVGPTSRCVSCIGKQSLYHQCHLEATGHSRTLHPAVNISIGPSSPSPALRQFTKLHQSEFAYSSLIPFLRKLYTVFFFFAAMS